MQSFTSIFKDESAKEAWTPMTQVSVLLDIIDSMIRQGRLDSIDLTDELLQHSENEQDDLIA